MARAPSVALAVIALPVALAGCPALLSDWTISGSGADDASTDVGAEGSPSADAGQDARDAGDGGQLADTTSDAGPEAEAGPTCVTDLSGVGTGDFSIAFTLTTTGGMGQIIPLVNQRAGCDQTSVWWQAVISSGGGILFGTCDGTGACEGVTGNAVNDGLPHRIVLDRVSGVIACSSDGVIGSTAPDTYSFGAFGAPLRIGTDACGDTPLAGHGTVTDLCITTTGGNDAGASSGGDAGTTPPSCQTSGAGRTTCPAGTGSESCCTSQEVTPNGSYYRTYTNSGSGPTGEADVATVSGFRLDKYLVTVGRFRQFVSAWNGGSGWTPPAGSGKHTHLNGGSGLNATGGGYEPGWVTSDNSNIAPTNANLACDATYATWTMSAGSNENLPINCVNWWESFAFCIWDGGFLPSEAEWEYAAAGGSQHREYPWGTAAPGTANQYAIYGCYYPSGSGSCTSVGNIAPVGFAASGAGMWGQLDLAGEMWESNLDWYASSYVNPCTDCANFTATSTRVVRGGNFNYAAPDLAPPGRAGAAPGGRGLYIGLRCSRTP